VASGVRELIVVAQDTTYYGMDMFGKPALTGLLKELSQVEGLDWIRLMYFYPMYIDDELIDTIADTPNILPYIDMPLQHINGDMLRRMSRRVTPDETRRLVERLRSRIDGLVLRTTFITGFPGETEQHVDELADFIAQSKFERLGVFTYSLEPDTPAARLDGHLPEDVKQARRDRLMQVQQDVAFEWTEQTVGNAYEVIIDKPFDVQRNVWIGRTYADAPDVDAVVYVTGQPRHPIAAGRIMPVEVVGHKDYDLIAATVGTGR
jgi:ribosomal protein S12 methylthiotransferase